MQIIPFSVRSGRPECVIYDQKTAMSKTKADFLLKIKIFLHPKSKRIYISQ